MRQFFEFVIFSKFQNTLNIVKKKCLVRLEHEKAINKSVRYVLI
jgi:hypothetical protein